MRYLSICSGIEAATVAWHPLGWTPAAFAEIDAFPSAVLAHHYPSVPNWGDMTKFKDWPDATVNVLVGGTPCQSFSVAGLRKGLADPRGNLALTYLALADRYRPEWLVWENVPGVLSSGGGRDFGAFLGGLGELGYGWAYRILDAQYFGLAQRRRRVFVVASARGWQRAAAVLFDGASLRGDSAPSQQTRQEVAGSLGAGAKRSGGRVGRREAAAGHLIASTGDLSHCLNAGGMGRIDYESETLLAHALRADGFDASEDGTGRGTPLIAFSVKDHGADAGELAPTLRSGGHDKSHANGVVMPAIAFDTTQMTSKANRSNPKPGDPCHPLASGAHAPAIAFANTAGDTALGLSKPGVPPITGRNGDPGNVLIGMQVRRLTPRECERLQGFPDDYTLIPYRGKPASDGPRYKALGNSMAVPVMAWIGWRLASVSEIETEDTASVAEHADRFGALAP